MAIEVMDRKTNRIRMVECPACGEKFGPYDHPGDHIHTSHGPEDFGLPAVGER